MGWDHQQQVNAKEYVCGFCNKHVASNRGYWENHTHDIIYLCPNCNQPTFFRWSDDAQIPDIKHGDEVKHLPENIEFFYEEARKCFSVACYTSATLICRKLLMNIAVTQGAKEGESFIWYVNFLTDKAMYLQMVKHGSITYGKKVTKQLTRYT